jgi:hypothetical protein
MKLLALCTSTKQYDCLPVHRILDPASKEKRLEVKKEAFTKLRMEKGSNDIFTSIREIRVEDDDDDDDNQSLNDIGSKAGELADTGGKNFDGWKPRYRIPCQSITVKQQHKKSVHVMVEVQKLKQERELIFDTLQDAQSFCDKLEQERELELDRAEARLQAALGDIKLPPFETVTLLVEIVSGWNLPIGDYTCSDPYVIAMMGRQQVHRTKHVPRT